MSVNFEFGIGGGGCRGINKSYSRCGNSHLKTVNYKLTLSFKLFFFQRFQ